MITLATHAYCLLIRNAYREAVVDDVGYLRFPSFLRERVREKERENGRESNSERERKIKRKRERERERE